MIDWAHGLYRSNCTSLEVTRSVTTFTVSAKVSTVRVAVTLDTKMTSHWESPIQLRDSNLLPVGNAKWPSLRSFRLMAQRARRFLVWSRPRKFRHTIVIELRRPLLGAVALGTVLAQFAAVLVVLLVAVETTVLAQLVLVLIVT